MHLGLRVCWLHLRIYGHHVLITWHSINNLILALAILIHVRIPVFCQMIRVVVLLILVLQFLLSMSMLLSLSFASLATTTTQNDTDNNKNETADWYTDSQSFFNCLLIVISFYAFQIVCHASFSNVIILTAIVEFTVFDLTGSRDLGRATIRQ